MSGDIFGSSQLEKGVSSTPWVKTRDAATLPSMCTTAAHTEDFSHRHRQQQRP